MAETLANQPSINEELRCRFCDKRFNNVLTYIDHVRCKDHYRMVKISETKSKAELLRKFKEMEDLKTDRSFVCPECGTKFSCWKNADDHFQSPQHTKKISENEMDFILFNMKPKTVPPTTQTKLHRSSSPHQNDGGHKSAQRDNGENSEPASHDHTKLLAKNKKTRAELEKTKINVKADEVAAVVTLENSLSGVKKAISDSEAKERALKSNNIKVSLRKANANTSKGQNGRKLNSISKDIQGNEIVRSTKGIAYFLPSDSINVVNTAPAKVSPSYEGLLKQNAGKVTITKRWNYQEDICISTASRVKSKNSGIHEFIEGPNMLSAVESNHKGKLTTTCPNQNNKRIQKQLSHFGAESSSMQNNVLLQNGIMKKSNQKDNHMSAMETASIQLKSRSRQRTNSIEGINGIEKSASNKARKNYNSGLLNATEKQNDRKEQNWNSNNNIKIAVKSPVNKGKVNGQCKNCGHSYFIDITTNKQENAITRTSNHMVQSSNSDVTSSRSRGRNSKANK